MTTYMGRFDRSHHLSIYGHEVVVSPYAEKVTKAWVVKALPIRKRRRQYRVVEEITRTPAVLKVHSQFVVHPNIYAELRKMADRHLYSDVAEFIHGN